MCGIVGLLDRKANKQQLCDTVLRMNAVQVHRGPDDNGHLVEENHNLAIAMQRLSIQDVLTGKQPMNSRCGRYSLILNGEIVNAPSLRRKMEADGIEFFTANSDTEVLLNLLIELGDQALIELNGMFAFAFFDRLSATLLLSRDEFGIKPLFYSMNNGRFAFSSEIKSLLAINWVNKDLNKQAISDFLSLMYVKGEKRIFSSVHQLEPGNSLKIDLSNSKVKITKWSTNYCNPKVGVSSQDYLHGLREEMLAACKRWTISDVPLAMSLSGGLDSSIVASMIKEMGREITSFSLGFSGQGEQQFNELELAQEQASLLGLEHHEIIMKPENLLEDLSSMVWHLEEPYGGGLPSWLVYKEIGKRFKVAFTGVGGDELFGNYGKWLPFERSWPFRILGTKFLFGQKYINNFHYWSASQKEMMLTREFHSESITSEWFFNRYAELGAQGIDHRDRIAMLDFETQLPNEFLAMTDRFSMAHGVEARPPILDKKFVRAALDIPSSVRTNPKDMKFVLKQVGERFLSPRILNAPKRGFVLPLDSWLKKDLSHLVNRLFDERHIRKQGIFKPEVITQMLRSYRCGGNYRAQQMWALVMFQIWYLQFVDNPNPSSPINLQHFIEG